MGQRQGYWIPIKVWNDDRLSLFEQRLYTLLLHLDEGEEGFQVTNDSLAEEMRNVTHRNIIKGITKLVELGYIEREVYTAKGFQTIRILYIKK